MVGVACSKNIGAVLGARGSMQACKALSEMETTRSPPLNSFGAKKPPKTRFTLKSQEWNFHGEFHYAGYQVVYFTLNENSAQKTEMFFLLHVVVTYKPVAYLLENIGLGHLHPPDETV